jgi:WS/DGAT/MGAT family acyltransferase
MSAFETLMWRGEADPRLRSTGTIVEVLDGAPEWTRLVRAHERATELVPRLRERVVEPTLPIAPPAWSIDDKFDLRYHLRRVALPAPGTFRQLLDAACSFGQTPLDRARPQWESMLVDGLDGGRSAYVLKFHHSLADGHGLIQLLSMTHGDSPEPRPHPNPERFDATRERQSEMGVMLRELVAAPLGLTRVAMRALGRGAAAVRDPLGAGGEVLDFTRSMKRILAPPEVTRSPLLSQSNGLGWRFVAHELSLADLKAGARAGGGSLNDGFIAALLGALKRYHDRFGVPVDQIPIGIPVSVRSADDSPGGNKFAAAKFAGPHRRNGPPGADQADTNFHAERPRRAGHRVLDALSPVLSRLPARVIAEMTAQFANSLDLQASNVPGLTRPAYISGTRVTHVYAFGPRPGCAAMMALLSHNGTCCVAGNIDPDAITDLELFERCLRDGFQEIVDLAGPSGH